MNPGTSPSSSSRTTTKYRQRLRKSFAATLILIASLVFAGEASCQDYPAKPVRLVVPFAPGGGVDITARLLAQSLSVNLGQQIVIDNRGGAGGIVGMEIVARAAPDGYTLLMSHVGFTAMPGLYKKLPFDPVNDFTGVVVAHLGRLRARRQPRRAGQISAGAHCLREGQSRQAKLCLGGQRVLDPPRGRALQEYGRPRSAARAVQGCGSSAHRRRRGRGADDVRHRDQYPAHGEGRQAARARGDFGEALSARAGAADRGRERAARIRGRGMVRIGRAGEDAAPAGRADQRRH